MKANSNLESLWILVNGTWMNMTSGFRIEVAAAWHHDGFGGDHITGYDVQYVFSNYSYVTLQRCTSNESAQEFIKEFLTEYFGGYRLYDCEEKIGYDKEAGRDETITEFENS